MHVLIVTIRASIDVWVCVGVYECYVSRFDIYAAMQYTMNEKRTHSPLWLPASILHF